jgi:hypothetical protein
MLMFTFLIEVGGKQFVRRSLCKYLPLLGDVGRGVEHVDVQMLGHHPIALGISAGVGVQVTDGIVLLNDLIDAIANAVLKERFDVRPRPGYSQP